MFLAKKFKDKKILNMGQKYVQSIADVVKCILEVSDVLFRQLFTDLWYFEKKNIAILSLKKCVQWAKSTFFFFIFLAKKIEVQIFFRMA